MEMEPGKLFIGGISWDTNEDRLREYFQTFGEIIEAVIMKDRTTGRARGFGFVVFADPAVAERVIKDKHMIDGRTVEAKKAVPRDDQQILNRNSGSVQGSPGPTRTKKIFVGGLASTVTETDFKKYFDQFGTITDIVVMYDHNTQRPRGFGFITFDSEEAVDRVLLRTFHELNGKMVEVKRAVPKELSPGPNQSPLAGYSYSVSRATSFLNTYTQGYNPNSIGRYSPITVGRSGYLPFNPSGYGLGPNSEPGFSPNGNFGSNLGYGRGLNPFYNANTNRYTSPVGYGGNGSLLNSNNQNMWGNTGSLNYPNNSVNSNDYMGARNGNTGLVGSIGNIGAIWGSSGGGNGTGLSRGNNNFNYGNGDNGFGPGGGAYGRNTGGSGGDGSGVFGNFYGNGGGGGGVGGGGGGGGGSFYGVEPTWRSASPELHGGSGGSYGYGLSNGAATAGSEAVMPKSSVGYVGYSVANRSNRGIAA